MRSFRPIDYVFLKIDVEGMEYEILQHLFDQGGVGIVDEISIEFHSRIRELSGFADRERFFLARAPRRAQPGKHDNCKGQPSQ